MLVPIFTINPFAVNLEDMQVLTNDQIIHLAMRENHFLMFEQETFLDYGHYFVNSEN